MYQAQLSRRDRTATFVAVALIHVTLAFVLINISPAARQQLPEEVVDLLSITEPPPPPVIDLQEEKEQAKPKREEGAASPKSIESKATPVVQPKPRIQLPVPEPKPATQTPNQGNQPTQGASTVVGPGTGGGGTGGIATRPAVIRGITNRDYPDEVSRYWPRGGAVFIAVRVLPNGRATDCKINRSIGIPAIDQWTCKLVEERAVFRPATDASGRPVAAWFGYVQQERGR